MTPPGIPRPYRVLVVEQDRERARELRTLLSRDDCECEVALDLETAEQVTSDRRMEAVVVDLAVDGVSADDALEAFGSSGDEYGLVFFNGSTDESIQRRYRREGADSYLSHKSDLKRVANAARRNINNGQ